VVEYSWETFENNNKGAKNEGAKNDKKDKRNRQGAIICHAFSVVLERDILWFLPKLLEAIIGQMKPIRGSMLQNLSQDIAEHVVQSLLSLYVAQCLPKVKAHFVDHLLGLYVACCVFQEENLAGSPNRF
jgi:hypothetical protein